MSTSAKALLLSAGLALALPCGGALADDSVANLDAGGLVLGKNDQIELRAEDVFLSTRQIRVAYRFYNKGDKDLPLAVSFALPDIAGEQDLAVAIPGAGSANFLNFQTKVNGQQAEAALEQHAFFTPDGGQETEITDLLKGLNVPLMPFGDATAAAIRQLGAEDRAKLTGAGYASIEGDSVTPLWTLRSTFTRQQVFPARKEVLLQHSFTPSVGTASGVYFDKANLTGESLAQYQKKYCTNDGFLRAADLLTKRIAEAKAKGGEMPGDLKAQQTYFGYAIAKDSLGPIGRFDLTIDKAFPDNLVSFCADGAQKMSSTRYELKKMNYTPDRNIDVLILDKHAVK
ncbi:DUF4424 family protein [Labrys okinawensis]|uniref:DUF4424 family protein n=1 Tax=Labrys okinawensis TaxID=346911 RepID=UPI0039BD2B94